MGDAMTTAATPRVDALADYLRTPACDELRELLDDLYPADFTVCEMVALVTILRGARERKTARQMQPASLELVRKAKRRPR